MTDQASAEVQLTAAKVVRWLSHTSMMVTVALLVSLSLNVVLTTLLFGKRTAVIAVDQAGRAIPIIPLTENYVTEPRVVSFAEECLRDAFGHDFENSRSTVNRALSCFTEAGGKDFYAKLEPFLVDIQTRRMVMSVTMDEPAVIQRAPYVLDGVKHWEVGAKVKIYRAGQTERIPSQPYKVQMVITRVPLDIDPRGIAVERINLSPV